ncbi:MAG: hypothetical protein ACTSYO_05680 [Candidatus Ranarchaeia archaeon]
MNNPSETSISDRIGWKKLVWLEHVCDLILSSVLPVTVGVMFAWVVWRSSPSRLVFFYLFGYSDFYYNLFSAVIYTGLGVLVVLVLNMMMDRFSVKMGRYIVSFILSPVLFVVMVVFTQTLLLVALKGASIDIVYSVLAFGSIYASVFLVFLVSVDALSPRAKNMFVIFYGSVFGAAIGLNAPTGIVFTLILTLAIEDYLLVSKSEPNVSYDYTSDPYDDLRFKTKNIIVGVGDIIVFSVIGSHAFYFFPFPVFIVSIALLFIGVLVLFYTSIHNEKMVPGLFIPSILSLAPWMIWIIVTSI